MGCRRADGSEARFTAYVEALASVIGHADRLGPLDAYWTGLILPRERKSVETAMMAPARVSAAARRVDNPGPHGASRRPHRHAPAGRLGRRCHQEPPGSAHGDVVGGTRHPGPASATQPLPFL
jgi:hypothetical protein